MRFILVGVISGLTYVGLVFLLTQGFQTNAYLASVIAYLAVIPFNYWAHRSLTFKSEGAVGREFLRFCMVHAINILLALGGMAFALELLGVSPTVGAFIAFVLVPVATFLALRFWVFFAGPPEEED